MREAADSGTEQVQDSGYATSGDRETGGYKIVLRDGVVVEDFDGVEENQNPPHSPAGEEHEATGLAEEDPGFGDEAPGLTDERSGTPDEDSEPTAESVRSAVTETADSGEVKDRKWPVIVASILVVLTAACCVFAFWFYSEAHQLRDEGPAANQALVDPAATSDVNGQITTAIQEIFSYDFANTAKTANTAKNVLVGPAIQQYNALFATVKKLAPQQKLVLTTTVRSSAVTLLQGNRAQVLLFVDQNAVRTDTGQSNVGPAQITVSAVKQGTQWKIQQIVQH